MYIARKHSKGRKRFGFVRMNGKEDADRVIERLHGFKLYGSLLTVKHARNTHEHWGRFAGRDKEKGEETSCKEWGKYVNQRMKEDGTTREPGGSSNLIEVRQKHLMGHVEEEDLWKIRKCLVGEMTTICSIFSETLNHGWNGTTLKKIAGLWETFEAMGVNANHSRDCEKVTVLISTKQVKKIDEVIEMEVGDKIFEVGVVELGFSDDSDTTVGKKGTEVNVICEEVQESESISDSKSEQENKEVVGDDRSCSSTEEEALNVMCAKKTSINAWIENWRILEAKLMLTN
ncbi:hypothetical protein V6N13_104540 [Hibiscus sabdariffa]